MAGEGVIEWRKGKALGSGSYGQVYLGLNVKTGKFMAVKQIRISRNLATEGRLAAAVVL